MKKLIGCIMGMVMASSLLAAPQYNVEITMNAPVDRLDGTLLTDEEISHYNVVYTRVGGVATNRRIEKSELGDVSFDDVGFGTHCFSATIVDTDGVPSTPTEQACETIVNLDVNAPNPPSIDINVIIITGNND